MSRLDVVMLTTPNEYQSMTARAIDVKKETPFIGFFIHRDASRRFLIDWDGFFFRLRGIWLGRLPLLLGRPGPAFAVIVAVDVIVERPRPRPFREERGVELASTGLPPLDEGEVACPWMELEAAAKSAGQEVDLCR